MKKKEYKPFVEKFCDPLERIMAYAGTTFETCRRGNPNLTKRETIQLANQLMVIFDSIGEWDQETIKLIRDYNWRKQHSTEIRIQMRSEEMWKKGG